jgi:hypothetical protein
VDKGLFKNNLIIFKNESQFTAEAQRTLRPRREEARGFSPLLLLSLRWLSVLCASAVNCDYHAK